MKLIFPTILALTLLAGCATPSRVNLLSLSDTDLVRHYHEVSAAADNSARQAQAYQTRNNWVWSGLKEAETDSLQQDKINTLMELRRRGVAP